MSGLDLVIYIAGILLLSKLFLRQLIGLIHLARRTAYAARAPLLPAQQTRESVETRSRRVSDLATCNSDE